jgi:hypothetical protein
MSTDFLVNFNQKKNVLIYIGFSQKGLFWRKALYIKGNLGPPQQ